MKKSIVIADNFRLIHNTHLKLIKYVNNLINSGEYEQCFILIAQEDGDFLGQYEKEHMLQKIINKSDKFIIQHIDSLKMFKDIKNINDTYDAPVFLVLVEPFQYNYIKNSIDGLPLEIKKYNGNTNADEVEDTIVNNNYQDFCKLVPLSIQPEFENLKDIYKDKRISENLNSSEESMKKENKKDLNSLTTELNGFIAEKIDTVLDMVESGQEEPIMVEDKERLFRIAEKLIIEKLYGKEFDEMHQLKTQTLKNIQKIVKNKWLLDINKISKKNDGTFIIKLVGSGNTRLNIIWGESINGDFAFNTSVQLVAGDKYSTGLYAFMNDAMAKVSNISDILKDVQGKIKDNSEEDDDEDMNDIADINSDDNNDFGGELGVNQSDSNYLEEPGESEMELSSPETEPVETELDDISTDDIDNNIPDEEEEIEDDIPVK